MSTVIKIVIAVVLVVVVAVVAVVLLTGGDDDKESASKQTEAAETETENEDGSPRQDAPEGQAGKDAPRLRTVVRGRANGAQARATAAEVINRPGQIWLRTSAAPKQGVSVTWSLLCGEGAAVQRKFRVAPPDLRQLDIPGRDDPAACTASVAAQLDDRGRVKIAVLRER